MFNSNNMLQGQTRDVKPEPSHPSSEPQAPAPVRKKKYWGRVLAGAVILFIALLFVRFIPELRKQTETGISINQIDKTSISFEGPDTQDKSNNQLTSPSWSDWQSPILEMVYVPGGSFTMGDTFGDGNRDERPTHSVTVSSFYIGKYEVTQSQWQDVMGNNPSLFIGDNRPVTKVNWYDALKFCNKLSERKGLTPCYTICKDIVTCNWNADGYRLPTEAEWEYAARGGKKSNGYKFSGSNRLGSVAWYFDNSHELPRSIGQKQSNELGIYDMSGNVWEWCWDWYDYYSKSRGSNQRGPGSGNSRVL